jgi:predicted permease
MEVPLVKGRFFTDRDTKDAPQVVLIDQKMAQRFWPGSDGLGKRVKQGGPKDPWLTIVGVVGIVKEYGLDIDGRMVVYYPHQQLPTNGLYIVARTGTDPATVSSAIIQQVHALDPDVPVYDVRTMPDRLRGSLARQRFSMTMLGAFAGFALVLAAVGVYGVMSYLVTQGIHDIGVRIALGAQQGNILGLVLRQGMTVALIGIAGGLAGAFALTRLMASLLFGVNATDVATFSAVAVFLVIIALVATYVPARRAMNVDPLIALRYE